MVEWKAYRVCRIVHEGHEGVFLRDMMQQVMAHTTYTTTPRHTTPHAGTPFYLSPEICEGRRYNKKSDIWSLGCILYELATLKHAFNGRSLPALVMKILRGNYPPIPEHYSQNLKNLIAAMLQLNPKQRPSINEIITMPYVREHINKFLAECDPTTKMAIEQSQHFLRRNSDPDASQYIMLNINELNKLASEVAGEDSVTTDGDDDDDAADATGEEDYVAGDAGTGTDAKAGDDEHETGKRDAGNGRRTFASNLPYSNPPKPTLDSWLTEMEQRANELHSELHGRHHDREDDKRRATRLVNAKRETGLPVDTPIVTPASASEPVVAAAELESTSTAVSASSPEIAPMGVPSPTASQEQSPPPHPSLQSLQSPETTPKTEPETVQLNPSISSMSLDSQREPLDSSPSHGPTDLSTPATSEPISEVHTPSQSASKIPSTEQRGKTNPSNPTARPPARPHRSSLIITRTNSNEERRASLDRTWTRPKLLVTNSSTLPRSGSIKSHGSAQVTTSSHEEKKTSVKSAGIISKTAKPMVSKSTNPTIKAKLENKPRSLGSHPQSKLPVIPPYKKPTASSVIVNSLTEEEKKRQEELKLLRAEKRQQQQVLQRFVVCVCVCVCVCVFSW